MSDYNARYEEFLSASITEKEKELIIRSALYEHADPFSGFKKEFLVELLKNRIVDMQRKLIENEICLRAIKTEKAAIKALLLKMGVEDEALPMLERWEKANLVSQLEQTLGEPA